MVNILNKFSFEYCGKEYIIVLLVNCLFFFEIVVYINFIVDYMIIFWGNGLFLF